MCKLVKTTTTALIACVALGFLWVCFSFVVRMVRVRAAQKLRRGQTRKRGREEWGRRPFAPSPLVLSFDLGWRPISLTSPTHKRKAHKKNHCYAGSRKNTFVFPSLKDFFSESNSWSISVQSLLSPESVLPRNSTLYLQDEQGYRNVLKYVH